MCELPGSCREAIPALSMLGREMLSYAIRANKLANKLTARQIDAAPMSGLVPHQYVQQLGFHLR